MNISRKKLLGILLLFVSIGSVMGSVVWYWTSQPLTHTVRVIGIAAGVYVAYGC
jgi:hypothetical protein